MPLSDDARAKIEIAIARAESFVETARKVLHGSPFAPTPRTLNATSMRLTQALSDMRKTN